MFLWNKVWTADFSFNLLFWLNHLKVILFFRKSAYPQNSLKSTHYIGFSNMYNTYRFVTKCGNCKIKKPGTCWKISFVNKNRQCLTNQKVWLLYFHSSPYSDSLGPIWVLKSYAIVEMTEEKKLRYWNTENLFVL